jgi:hypothetical protein
MLRSSGSAIAVVAPFWLRGTPARRQLQDTSVAPAGGTYTYATMGTTCHFGYANMSF